MTDPSTRRQFLHYASGALAIAASSTRASANSGPHSSPVAGGDLNLLTDPRFSVGAKFRMGQFIKKGADPKAAEAIFSSLPDLAPQPWVDAWSRLAQPLEAQGATLEAQGKAKEASAAFQKASFYYGIAKFPVINHPAKQAAYRKCVSAFLKAARYFDPPLERVTIPFEGKEIIGYLSLPKQVSKPPVVIATGGVDVYEKEERETPDLLDAGLAAFSTDMPGNGECPLWYTTDAERFYTAILDYLVKRDDLDGQRIGIVGRSYGGYWGGKMAYVESKRIRAAVGVGIWYRYPLHFPRNPGCGTCRTTSLVSVAHSGLHDLCQSRKRF